MNPRPRLLPPFRLAAAIIVFCTAAVRLSAQFLPGAGATRVSPPMSAAALTGLQHVLGTPYGAQLIQTHLGLNDVLGFPGGSPIHLQTLGPLAARLPDNFPALVATADSPEAAQSLAKVVAQAYTASLPTALAEFDSRSRQALTGVTEGPAGILALETFAREMSGYSIYGRETQSRVATLNAIVRSARADGKAKDWAKRFMAGLPAPESMESGSSVAGNAIGNSRKVHAPLQRSANAARPLKSNRVEIAEDGWEAPRSHDEALSLVSKFSQPKRTYTRPDVNWNVLRDSFILGKWESKVVVDRFRIKDDLKLQALQAALLQEDHSGATPADLATKMAQRLEDAKRQGTVLMMLSRRPFSTVFGDIPFSPAQLGILDDMKKTVLSMGQAAPNRQQFLADVDSLMTRMRTVNQWDGNYPNKLKQILADARGTPR